jgi:hypothetical protein
MKPSKTWVIERLINADLNTIKYRLIWSSNVTTIRTCVGVFSSIFAVSSPSLAHAQQSNLGAHVHGVSELNIAIEGNKLEIQLRSPAMNIVGFEHKAGTEQQIIKVKQSEVKLNDHEALFSFSSGGCKLNQAQIDLSDLIKSHATEKNSHTSSKHAHHKHALDHNQEHEYGNHSEIVAHYYYDCEDMNELSSLSFGFFDVFPTMQHINGIWITTSGQGAVALTSQNKTIMF